MFGARGIVGLEELVSEGGVLLLAFSSWLGLALAKEFGFRLEGVLDSRSVGLAGVVGTEAMILSEGRRGVRNGG